MLDLDQDGQYAHLEFLAKCFTTGSIECMIPLVKRKKNKEKMKKDKPSRIGHLYSLMLTLGWWNLTLTTTKKPTRHLGHDAKYSIHTEYIPIEYK